MTDLALSHLSLLFKQQIPAHEVACIVIEPVLGEGGYVPAPKAWLQGLREICDREGIVLGESYSVYRRHTNQGTDRSERALRLLDF
jgi:hypothetical protein